MSDRRDGPEREANPGDATRVQQGLVRGGVPALVLGIVVLATGLGGSAVTVVGIVLAEAIVLYVGYGVLTRAVDQFVSELIASD